MDALEGMPHGVRARGAFTLRLVLDLPWSMRVQDEAPRTPNKQALYRSMLNNVPYPVQVLWAAHDPALKIASYGEAARKAVGLSKIESIPAKHFLQEDQPPAIADYVARIAKRGTLSPGR
jgi:pimeloyl-ACP methyl ester carboxylesterase